jgi:anaerobic dimethyl sulfoxide reductase subunit A
MWGWNPAEMRDGTNSDYFIKLARQNGARVVCIDPRHSLSAAALADEWIPIRPGTDAAMMTAMAYVMLTEGLLDAAFVNATASAGIPPTCRPATKATRVTATTCSARATARPKPPSGPSHHRRPAETIARIAREYATLKPAVLYQGYGMQRRAYGEQVVRAGCVLAAITGNFGISGGWASGLGLQAPDGGGLWTVFPTGENPVKAAIPVFLWTEACLRGKSMTPLTASPAPTA